MLAILWIFSLPVFAQQSPEANLHIAVLQGDLEIVQEHIKAGSDLDQKDSYGSSPLTIAVTFGKTAIVKALIEAGADLKTTDMQGSNPLHIAAFFGRAEIASMLLDAGVDSYARNIDGSTALEIAATPFEDDRAVYAQIRQALAPLGLVLDDQQTEANRLLIAEMLRPGAKDLALVNFAPAQRGDWSVSTPAEAGLDPAVLAELYFDAVKLENLWGLLVIKDGKLIAEDYFHQGAIDQLSTRHSVTKSVVSALYGIARNKGCMPDLDRKMIEFFPEQAALIKDPRKRDIDIRQMLQMRSGYPTEFLSAELNDALFYSKNWQWAPYLVDFPLVDAPGTNFQYSNLSSDMLAVMLAQSCDTDLLPFAQNHLFDPINARIAKWSPGPDGYRMGWGEIQMTARDMAKFGLTFLDDGQYDGKQVVPADWVDESLQIYSRDPWITPKIGRYLHEIGYGYLWWSARAGEHRFDFAWGHGGQLIVLLDDLDMVIVTTADPQLELDPVRDTGWQHEQAIINVIGRFIASLPDG